MSNERDYEALVREAIAHIPEVTGMGWRDIGVHLLSSSPVLQRMVTSSEGQQFVASLQGLRKATAKALLAEGVITAEEAIDLGVIDLVRRLAQHTRQQIASGKGQDERSKVMQRLLERIGQALEATSSSKHQ